MATQSKIPIFLNSAFQSHHENHVPPTNRVKSTKVSTSSINRAEVQTMKNIQHSAEHKHGEVSEMNKDEQKRQHALNEKSGSNESIELFIPLVTNSTPTMPSSIESVSAMYET
jgi:hypothetical protein